MHLRGGGCKPGGIADRLDKEGGGACGLVGGFDFVDTRTRGMAQAGGGVTFVVGDGWGLFIDAMYRRMFLDDEEDFTSGRNDVRVAGGFRLILD